MPGDVLDFYELGAAAYLYHKMCGGAGAADEEITDVLEALTIITPVVDNDGVDVVDSVGEFGEGIDW